MSQTDLPFRELVPFELFIPCSFDFIHIKKKASILLQGMICLMCVILEQSFIFMMYWVELFYQYYGMCKENTVFQPYRIEMLKNHSGLQSGHASYADSNRRPQGIVCRHCYLANFKKYDLYYSIYWQIWLVSFKALSVKHCLLSKYANYSQAKPAVKKGEWMVNDEICSDIDYSEYCWLSKIVGESYDAGKMED